MKNFLKNLEWKDYIFVMMSILAAVNFFGKIDARGHAEAWERYANVINQELIELQSQQNEGVSYYCSDGHGDGRLHNIEISEESHREGDHTINIKIDDKKIFCMNSMPTWEKAGRTFTVKGVTNDEYILKEYKKPFSK